MPSSLTFPPNLNAIWRAMVINTEKGPTARVLLSRESCRYRRTVQNVIRSLGNPTTPTGARLALTLTACPPYRRARDLSNMPKGRMQGCAAGQARRPDCDGGCHPPAIVLFLP
ncbi:hypothetical protein GCM10008955_40700 [Deinococcus malanensis]|uniref:Uncharacterized protein n=1 Tax=Deinococcus malanensis TaxID=1706855 RepID=A0ABQ2F4Y8_9DEIO|nr:hypothetical protein [Deinococcus malanensis]GGK42767.1 hypothetical protein GCM10008955_40700 [Deinococcus malanensis]